MRQPPQAEHLAKPLRDAVYAIAPGDFAGVARLLSDPLWDTLEADFWNASHPLPPEARQALEAYLHLAKTLWHRAGIGQSHPIALYKTTLLSSKAISTAGKAGRAGLAVAESRATRDATDSVSWHNWGGNMDDGLVAAFAAAIAEGSPVPITGEDGLRAAEVALAAYRSAELRQPVTLPA